jgi:hypothetical protein
MYRQGDVLLVPVHEAAARVILRDAAAKPVAPEGGRLILALGEATGHAHAASASHATLYGLHGDRYLHVREVTPLLHEEHAPIELPPGLYRVVRQREYDPDRDRFVRD